MDLAASRPRFPPAWFDADRWAVGLRNASGALDAISSLFLSIAAFAHVLREKGPVIQQWLVDCGSWLQTAIASVVRDAWVHPRAKSRKVEPSSSAQPPHGNSSTDGAVEQLLESSLRTEHARGNVGDALLHKCLRWLRPQQPQPRRRMVLPGESWPTTAENTHKGWCDLVKNQAGNNTMTGAQSMERAAEEYAGRERRAVGKGAFDQDVAYSAVFK